jgi:type II secretory pathway pseudopilin PulG
MVKAGRSDDLARSACKSGERGFTYLWVLAAIAVLSVGLLAVSEVWVTSARRQRLAELDWIGAQYTKAIGSYYQSTPGAVKAYPSTLQELIEDRRYLTMRRHLRVIYPNPFTAKTDWEFVRSSDGRIRGVRAKVPGDDGTAIREYVYWPS